jgi:predicted methyltransferase
MIRLDRAWGTALAAAAVTWLIGMSALAAVPDYVLQAVLSSERPAEDRQQDGNRNPSDVLAFLGVRPGDVVLDVRAGGGYYTELLSRIVGPNGTVYAQLTEGQAQRAGDGLHQRAERLGNVEVLVGPLHETGIEPGTVDRIIVSQVLHDLFNLEQQEFMAKRRAMYDLLRPNGVVVVVDHAAAQGTGSEHTNTLHRVEPRAAAQSLAQVGFIFDARSDALRNPDDDHTLGVFDEALRGQTDRFVQCFIKPPRSR